MLHNPNPNPNWMAPGFREGSECCITLTLTLIGWLQASVRALNAAFKGMKARRSSGVEFQKEVEKMIISAKVLLSLAVRD